jgi:hypothetical protein
MVIKEPEFREELEEGELAKKRSCGQKSSA